MRRFLTDEREAGDKSLTRCPVKYNERMRPTATRGLSARFPLPAYCAALTVTRYLRSVRSRSSLRRPGTSWYGGAADCTLARVHVRFEVRRVDARTTLCSAHVSEGVN